MSNILYIGAMVMSFTEKSSWVYAVIAVVFPIGYVVAMASLLQRTPAADIQYQLALLGAIGAAVIAAVVAHIAIVIGAPRDARMQDERDRAIDHHGEYATGLALAAGMLGVLGLVLLEVEYFWVASAMYLVFALSGFVGTVVKIVAYRRGLSTW